MLSTFQNLKSDLTALYATRLCFVASCMWARDLILRHRETM